MLGMGRRDVLEVCPLATTLGAVLTMLLLPAAALADDAQIIAGLRQKGATITATKGILTGVNVSDCKALTEDDYQAIGKLSHLKSLSFGLGFNGKSLAHLAPLTELELFATNGMQFTDADLELLKPLKNLKSLAFFHPGKDFTGQGFAHLVGLAQLARLTVGGSSAFNDDGMAAIGKLTQLEEVRVWHVVQTNAGLKHLVDLPKLKSLTLGQRLTFKPPASPDAESMATLARCKALETLQLDEARLSLEILQPLKELPHLKRLVLRNIELSKADLARLKQKLPKVDIQWTAPAESSQKRIDALFGAK